MSARPYNLVNKPMNIIDWGELTTLGRLWNELELPNHTVQNAWWELNTIYRLQVRPYTIIMHAPQELFCSSLDSNYLLLFRWKLKEFSFLHYYNYSHVSDHHSQVWSSLRNVPLLVAHEIFDEKVSKTYDKQSTTCPKVIWKHAKKCVTPLN